MGKFYNIKIWLEDRESELLKSHDFTEEVWESEIEEDKRYILTDLIHKGFIHSNVFEGKTYYQESGGYLQHFNKIRV